MEHILVKIRERIDAMSVEKNRLIVAIDGRCGSGKTTLAAELKRVYLCELIHTDDFFLRPEQRTAERLARPGENVDHERFLQEVLLPLSAGKSFSYRPFSCSSGTLTAPVSVSPCRITVVEGSYSCHPELRDFYDLRIFLSTDKESQLRRITERSGARSAAVFAERWIPLEEKYFSGCDVINCCDMYFET